MMIFNKNNLKKYQKMNKLFKILNIIISHLKIVYNHKMIKDTIILY